MRLRSALLLAFCLSLGLSTASSLVFVFRLIDRSAVVALDEEVPRALEEAVETYRDPALPDKEKLPRVMEDLLKVRRAFGRLAASRKPLLIGALEAFFLFLLAQGAILFVISWVASVLLTRPLAAIRAGLERVEAGEDGFRFPAFPGREVGLIGTRLNGMLDSIAEKERLLAEQARLLGWQETASFLAHQIKNPLAALCLAGKNLELALGQGALGGVAGESLALIGQESRRMSELITRFREAVRFPRLRLERAEMAEIADSAIALAPAGKARFETDMERGVVLSVDGELVREALLNLFSNSVEAAGGRQVLVRVALRREGEAGCLITVDDDVTGVPEEIAQRVLRETFSTKPGGSGLGLLLVRKVAALHGGSVAVRRADDGGLVFYLRLKEGGGVADPGGG
jgi:signal transduction histidine kinase